MVKHRLQFNMTGSAIRELDNLKEQAGCATRAELVRQALRLFGTVTQLKAEGKRVRIIVEDERVPDPKGTSRRNGVDKSSEQVILL